MTDLPASVRWQLWIVAFGFFMQSLDTTIVNTALPSMAKSLGESPLHMHMIIVSYVLTVAVMLPASGWLADRVGVRNIFFTAIVLFTAGSLFCAQASTLDQLVMARVLQGIGGAMMVPVGRLTVMKIVPRDQYMAAMTFVTLPGQIGPLLGPALGGVLVEYASWHWIFLINIPVGIVGAIATLCLMPNYTMQTRRFDLAGFVLLAAGMATLTLALDGQKGLGISPAWLAGLVAVGLAALLLYLWHARGNARALFSLNLFRNRTFSLGLGGSFAGDSENINGGYPILAWQGAKQPLAGDVNADGTVDVTDAELVYNYSIGAGELTEAELILADMDGDGHITARDAAMIYAIIAAPLATVTE